MFSNHTSTTIPHSEHLGCFITLHNPSEVYRRSPYWICGLPYSLTRLTKWCRQQSVDRVMIDNVTAPSQYGGPYIQYGDIRYTTEGSCNETSEVFPMNNTPISLDTLLPVNHSFLLTLQISKGWRIISRQVDNEITRNRIRGVGAVYVQPVFVGCIVV